MREICLVRLDKTRPAVVLTREAARGAMTKVTIAPITSTAKGLSSEVPVGRDNGLDHEGAVSLDNASRFPPRCSARRSDSSNPTKRLPWPGQSSSPTTSIFRCSLEPPSRMRAAL